ncbi:MULTISPECIES: hypothetical protein [Ochrobactrum]|uniref:Uncharacterized protein n=1 Tax=Ochrobactrum quorumnocens TaxID=271865 RepID=A0A5N1JU46_9HYPH|nr:MULTISPECIES: hypothetical protein [Brucella/Ochrobactrum group]KAA9367333.1 hypothetical protein F3W84_14585 [[Ochrobactrum] quorumnocens]
MPRAAAAVGVWANARGSADEESATAEQKTRMLRLLTAVHRDPLAVSCALLCPIPFMPAILAIPLTSSGCIVEQKEHHPDDHGRDQHGCHNRCCCVAFSSVILCHQHFPLFEVEQPGF